MPFRRPEAWSCPLPPPRRADWPSYDDFEDTELHSTVLIDKQGRVHWAHTGGAPFDDMAFLEKQLEPMNASVTKAEDRVAAAGQ